MGNLWRLPAEGRGILDANSSNDLFCEETDRSHHETNFLTPIRDKRRLTHDAPEVKDAASLRGGDRRAWSNGGVAMSEGKQ
jgi:hypothetical protein